MKQRALYLVVLSLVLGLTVLLAAPLAVGAEKDKNLTFYWISHGSEGDPIWIFALRGAKNAAQDLGVNLKSSFHHNDISTHKEAFKAAVAAKADGIATSSPDRGVLKEEVEMAKKRGIPVVFFNADDPDTQRDAYVGADNVTVGKSWASYLVDNGFVEEGDFVWMPVEVPGATYQRQETKGISSVFDPLGVEYTVFDAKYDPVQSLENMKSYLGAHKKKVDAIIGLGDMVMGNIKETFDATGVKPGEIPVVGWGNSADTAQEVKEGYVEAATWQYPQSQGYVPIVLLNMVNRGLPIGYNVTTVALYEQDQADTYLELASQ
ncbi:substrate-binding domain-containing protein [Candidatus Bipolaricaulota bacterium]|nr:substrate-binding domain-containing protein [Candidatus Bipolaricaulota bacterium]